MSGPFSWLPGAEDAPNDPDGRDAIAMNEAMQAKALEAFRESCRLFHDVFGTGRGPELLELLREKTIELDLMNVSATIGNGDREIPVNPAEWAYHRNGQNSVVRWIETMCREARRLETEESPNV